MGDLGKVAVIVPIIVIDEWLAEAVRSLLDQQGVAVEVIVYHDGIEPDPTQPWMADDRVTAWSRDTRGGLAVGLDHVIRRLDAPIIARLDGDDLARADRLLTQLEFLKTHPDVIVVGTIAHRIDANGAVTGTIGPAVGDDVRRDLLARNVLVHSSVMFRRSAYLEAGGFDLTSTNLEDYDLWMRMARLGPIAVIDEPLVSYRVSARQMSRGAAPRGGYMTAIWRSHAGLARFLGVPWAWGWLLRARWRSAQVLRYYRLRKFAYDR